MNAFTSGWVLWLFILAAFCGGIAYTYDLLSEKSATASYERCVDNFARTARDAIDLQHKIAVCKMDHGMATMQAGRYGTSTGVPITLAMTRRPHL